MKKCPKCGGSMTKEELGRRKFWDCTKGDCSGRILLDQRIRDAEPSAESLAVMARPKITLPAALTMDDPCEDAARPTRARRGKGPSLSEEARRRIGEGVRKAAAERRGRKTAQPNGHANVRITLPSPVAPTIHTTTTVGASPVNPLLALDQALRELVEQERCLTAQLAANHARQGALRKAALILQEVEAA